MTKQGEEEHHTPDAFEHLWRSINPNGDKERLMAMFTAYLDESYGPDDAYAVAGYVATVEQWEHFAREWREMLRDEGITELHKAKFEHFWGEYQKWQGLTKDERDDIKLRINKRACDIILRRVNAGFSASVKKSEWLTLDKGRWAKHIGESFYAAGVHACMHHVAAWAKLFKREGPIDYVFESGAGGATEVTRLLQWYEKDEKWRNLFKTGNWGFASKRPKDGDPNTAVVQLQAADFLAYESYKHMANCVVDGGKLNKAGQPFPMRGALRRALQHDQGPYADWHVTKKPTPHYMLYMDEGYMRAMVKASDERFPTHRNVLAVHYRALKPQEVKERYDARGETFYDPTF